MSKEEPAWRAELRSDLRLAQQGMGDLFTLVASHIYAAEQRGFSAGVSKSGDKVAELRKQLKTAKADALREAASKIRGPWRVGEMTSDERWLVHDAADLIDPDKS